MAKRKPAAPAKRHSMKIRSDDRVQVISGKDRGKTGRVLRVQPEAAVGGVIEREGPIHVSNVMLLDAKGKPTRVRIERENGQRVRVAKSTGARLD
jgi:large subunit ribosomal protein L24